MCGVSSVTVGLLGILCDVWINVLNGTVNSVAASDRTPIGSVDCTGFDVLFSSRWLGYGGAVKMSSCGMTEPPLGVSDAATQRIQNIKLDGMYPLILLIHVNSLLFVCDLIRLALDGRGGVEITLSSCYCLVQRAAA